ncbi:MAG: NAD(+)/NADH kinase [Anaerolineales bacterium]|jgi:NAD+ kinase|nr:NAD(+)/NADH kinase [Anaerolineales bacterium]
MNLPQPSPRHVVIVAHPKIEDSILEAERIADFLQSQGVHTAVGFLQDEDLHRRIRSNEFDLLIAVGGDGTMLRAGHLAGPNNIPILGINLGHFGFLMEIRAGQWMEIMPRLLQGDYRLEKRMMLQAAHWRHDHILGSWDVLNEVAVCRGHEVRPLRLATHLDGRFLTTYVADALIAATPTGSTAYALAAGGPILPPELRNILLVPVAPHLSIDRAIVLAEGSSVSIYVQSTHQAVFSVDGQEPVELLPEDRVEVQAGDHIVQFVRFQDPDYFYRNLTPHMSHNPSTGNSR